MITQGNKKGLGTVTGLINGSGSFIAAIGQLCVPVITERFGWSALWWFMLCATITACLLMYKKVRDARTRAWVLARVMADVQSCAQVVEEIFYHNVPLPPSKKGYASINTEEKEAPK